MKYTPYIFLIIASNYLSAAACAQTSARNNVNDSAQYDSTRYFTNILTGRPWEGGGTQEGDLIENIEQKQGELYFTGKCGGIITKDINQTDIKTSRYINFHFIICDFENIKRRDFEKNIYSINIRLINTDGDIIAEKYIEFPNDIEEKTVSADLREFSHFIDTNTLTSKFIFLNPSYPGKWGFKAVTITEKPAGALLRYDGFGFAPEEKEGTSLIPQPFIPKKIINQGSNLIREGDICPREGTVYDDNGGILSLFGYGYQVKSGAWIDIIIPDEFVIDIKNNPIMSLDARTEADVFNFKITARNTDGSLIIGENDDNVVFVEINNKNDGWNNYKISLEENIPKNANNTKIKSIRFCDFEGRGSKNKNYYEIELTGLFFGKE